MALHDSHARPNALPARADHAVSALQAVAEAVERLRFGAIHVTVHDGRVVQLDVTERTRFT